MNPLFSPNLPHYDSVGIRKACERLGVVVAAMHYATSPVTLAHMVQIHACATVTISTYAADVDRPVRAACQAATEVLSFSKKE